MTELEDRMPAPPLSWGERVLVGVMTILSVWGLGSTFWWLGSMLP